MPCLPFSTLPPFLPLCDNSAYTFVPWIHWMLPCQVLRSQALWLLQSHHYTWKFVPGFPISLSPNRRTLFWSEVYEKFMMSALTMMMSSQSLSKWNIFPINWIVPFSLSFWEHEISRMILSNAENKDFGHLSGVNQVNANNTRIHFHSDLWVPPTHVTDLPSRKVLWPG